MENVNEYILSLRGKASIPSPLLLDHDYTITSTGTCRRITTTPTDTGTVDHTYTFEPLTSEITDELGKVVEAKKKSKMSTAMRFQIIPIMRDLMPDVEDDETNYETAMHWIMKDLPNILTWLKKKYE
jgi:hypothetical protein